MPQWLFGPDGLQGRVEAAGDGRGGRGDVWPYLGWNGNFLATDPPDAQYFLEAQGSRSRPFTAAGRSRPSDGRSVENRAAGFTVHFDGQTKVAAAAPGRAAGHRPGQVRGPRRPARLQIRGQPGDALSSRRAGGEVVAGRRGLQHLAGRLVGPQLHLASARLGQAPGRDAARSDDLLHHANRKAAAAAPPSDTREPEYEMLIERVLGAVPKTKLLFFKCWEPRDGISPAGRPDVKGPHRLVRVARLRLPRSATGARQRPDEGTRLVPGQYPPGPARRRRDRPADRPAAAAVSSAGIERGRPSRRECF